MKSALSAAWVAWLICDLQDTCDANPIKMMGFDCYDAVPFLAIESLGFVMSTILAKDGVNLVA
jgi:hypothetical protein